MKVFKIVLFLVGALFTYKGINLYLSYFNFIDGDGIGIYFLGFEINDKVPIGYVPIYATSITILGIMLIIPMMTRVLYKIYK